MKFKALYFLLTIAFSLVFSDFFAQINFERNDSIIVLDTNGDTLKNPWAGGFNSVQFSEIDLNLDGIKDLFVFDRTGNRISTFINSGTPNQIAYTHDPSYTQYFPSNLSSWVLLRDYNCDGKMDIFTYSTGAMSAYRNTSTTELSFELDTLKVHSNYTPDTDTNNYIPLYISSVDIPAIDDIDNDGDLDILTFRISGSYVEYHKNLSVERTGSCSSLDFQLSNRCWGYFYENALNNGVVLDDTCDFNVNNPQKQDDDNKKHSGSTLLTLDLDGNNSKELVLGDVSFNNLVMLTNSDNSPDLSESYMTAFDYAFPQNNSSTTATDIDVFPAGYYLDINNDNIKDLIVAPNCNSGCNNNNNVHLYNNTNATNFPDFNLTTNSFLQEGMIEIGEGAHPVFFDYNADGLKDIIIGSYGNYDPLNGSLNYNSSLYLYENIGTLNAPSFHLVNTDYLGISSLNLDIAGNRPTLGLHPAFGDIDDDGDLDMLLGDYNGKLHFFKNSGGAGNPAVLTLAVPEYLGIDVGQNATPFFYDINDDTTLDLIIGKFSGTFSFYENTGTVLVPNFVYTTDSLGWVTTEEYGGFGGNSAPILVDSAGTTLLYSGSKSGNLFKFGNIDGNLTGTFSQDSAYLNYWDGINSILSATDINNDGHLDILVGNYSGGLSFLKGNSVTAVGINKEESIDALHIYPNPTRKAITIDINNNSTKNSSIELIDLLGKTLIHQQVTAQKTSINLERYAQGIYLVKFSNSLGSKVFKVIKE